MAFFDNIHFPFFTMQELNLDWILKELKRIAGFMPQDGNPGDVLTRKSDGAAWEHPGAVNIDINALPEDTEVGDNDQLIFYDISEQANRKIKPPNLLDSMMSNATPLMDGTGSAGTSKKPARYDHKHPTDTSRQAALSGEQMNAVNSGAPANAFNGGKLKVANGGTGADNADDAKTNLGIPVFSFIEEEITVSFSAGTIGTRGQQNLISSIPAGYKLFSAVCDYLGHSDQVLPFLFASSSYCYANFYRATTDPVSDVICHVRFILIKE